MRLTDQQIGAQLRALRTTPEPDFAARLDRRVAAEFSAGPRAKAAKRELTWGRLGLALAPLAAAAIAIVLIANGDLGSRGTGSGGESFSAPAARDQGGGISGSVPPAAPDTVAPGGTAEAVPPIAPTPPTGGRPRNGRPQVQELSASLGLTAPSGGIQEAADGVVEVTNRYDGFVDSSDVHVGGQRGHAFFTLRIPAVHLRDALDDLSDLGKVVSRDEGSANVTGAYIDAGKSYRDARAQVDSLIEDLRNASSPSEAAAIRRQLEAARRQLAVSRAALRDVKQRVTYAPVRVQIRAADDGSWSIGDATDDAVDVLEAIGGGLLVTLAVLVPLSALLALGLLGSRELQRRRRESALNQN